MSQTDKLLENARTYAASFDRGGLPSAPARKIAIVACMDARICPERLLGIAEGDAHVIRNAGGIVTDQEIRSLSISQHMLGTEEVIVLQHTDCGMTKFTDEEFAARLESHAGEAPAWNAATFGDLEGSVRASVERVRTSPFLPRRESVRGFVYDVADGSLREIR